MVTLCAEGILCRAYHPRHAGSESFGTVCWPPPGRHGLYAHKLSAPTLWTICPQLALSRSAKRDSHANHRIPETSDDTQQCSSTSGSWGLTTENRQLQQRFAASEVRAQPCCTRTLSRPRSRQDSQFCAPWARQGRYCFSRQREPPKDESNREVGPGRAGGCSHGCSSPKANGTTC